MRASRQGGHEPWRLPLDNTRAPGRHSTSRPGPLGPFLCPPRHPTAEKKRLTPDAPQIRPRQNPQHRDHGSHRRRQDDDDRAHPLLHRAHPQARRGARGRGDDGLDGAGAGARHHDHLGRDRLRVGRPPHQHHRHARPRRLHRRGRALAARARRLGRPVRLRRRRRAAVGERLAPGRQVPRPAHRLHQQDGPHRRGLLARRPDDDRPPRRAPGADPAADRRGGRLPRHHRPRREQGDRLQGRPRQGAGDRSRSPPSSPTRPPPRASTCSRRSPTTTTSSSR